MKAVKLAVTAGLILGLALSAAAADKTISFNNAVTLNGTTLQPGEYKLNYTTTGTTTEVKILKGKNTLATATGEMVSLERAASDDAIVTRVNDDGSRTIQEIQFAGKKSAIRFGGESMDKGK